MNKAQRILQILEISPKGWEGTVKKMKKHPEITNPYALTRYMQKRGFKSHKKPSGADKK